MKKLREAHPDQVSKSFCSMAFTQLHVSPMGNVKPCCIFDGSLKSPDGSTLRISDQPIEEIWNTPHLLEIREKMLAGAPIPECVKCMEEERVSGTSDRVRHHKVYPDVSRILSEARASGSVMMTQPAFLNLKIGNNCNLKCRMCQPLDSSSIDREFTQISKSDPEFRLFDNASAFDYYFNDEPIETAADWINLPLGKANIEKLLSTTKELALAGGEVVYTPQAVDLLKYCVQENLSKGIRLTLSSNLTRMSDDFVKLLGSFKMTTVVASIDGVGKVAEYIRHPSKWPVILENFIKLIKAPSNIEPVVAPTVQIYNVFDIVNVYQLVEDLAKEYPSRKWSELTTPVHLTILFSPMFLSIRNLPQDVRELALERLRTFIASSVFYKINDLYREQVDLLVRTLSEGPMEMDQEFSSAEYLSHFLKYTEVLDRARGENFSEALPELSNMLEAHALKAAFPTSAKRSFSYYSFRDAGFRMMDKGETAKALILFNKAYGLHQDDPDLLFSLGVAHKELANVNEAETFFRQTVDVFPSHYYGLVELGYIEKSRKRYNEALHFFEQAASDARDLETRVSSEEIKKITNLKDSHE